MVFNVLCNALDAALHTLNLISEFSSGANFIGKFELTRLNASILMRT